MSNYIYVAQLNNSVIGVDLFNIYSEQSVLNESRKIMRIMGFKEQKDYLGCLPEHDPNEKPTYNNISTVNGWFVNHSVEYYGEEEDTYPDGKERHSLYFMYNDPQLAHDPKTGNLDLKGITTIYSNCIDLNDDSIFLVGPKVEDVKNTLSFIHNVENKYQFWFCEDYNDIIEIRFNYGDDD